MDSDRKTFFYALMSTLALIRTANTLPWTDPPIQPNTHFLFMWNAPTELCESRFGMPLDLSYFHLISSTLKSATNQSISIFYIDRFGIFPYVDKDTGKWCEDGLPQLVDMKEHREEVENNIEFYIPVNQPGLAVLDFEEWRPQWDRNWGSKDIYRQISIERMKKKNATLSDNEVEDRARMAFEQAAKGYFLRSIDIGKRLRPKKLWGYYLYPDCYNYDYNQDMAGFSGQCPQLEMERNDELLWLWNVSTALFPSIYLELVLRDSDQARLFVRHRVQEAMRVSALANSSHSIPVYAYIRPVYKDSTKVYMSELDLVNTVGEAAALGAAGVISWGDMNVTASEDSCLDARRHLERVMNPYILNVSTATRLCSLALCQGRGRCVRKRWDSDAFLHLDPRRYWLQRKRRGGPLTVVGGLSQDDIEQFDRSFNCMCYSERPCRAVLTLNVIHDTMDITQPRSAGRPLTHGSHPLLQVALLCCLRALM
ncbi:hyaluronidase PH-20-like [Thalassophryne amazonica]|uniref:hyaluronidase PH-20-like n=1 Tax=Thalassophryne amazonica TaxID=390379 RepID=UPI001471B36D|nr:hyaluronidase PH-20-like [Thalassophryne amazonica]